MNHKSFIEFLFVHFITSILSTVEDLSKLSTKIATLKKIGNY